MKFLAIAAGSRMEIRPNNYLASSDLGTARRGRVEPQEPNSGIVKEIIISHSV